MDEDITIRMAAACPVLKCLHVRSTVDSYPVAEHGSVILPEAVPNSNAGLARTRVQWVYIGALPALKNLEVLLFPKAMYLDDEVRLFLIGAFPKLRLIINLDCTIVIYPLGELESVDLVDMKERPSTHTKSGVIGDRRRVIYEGARGNYKI